MSNCSIDSQKPIWENSSFCIIVLSELFRQKWRNEFAVLHNFSGCAMRESLHGTRKRFVHNWVLCKSARGGQEAQEIFCNARKASLTRGGENERRTSNNPGKRRLRHRMKKQRSNKERRVYRLLWKMNPAAGFPPGNIQVSEESD